MPKIQTTCRIAQAALLGLGTALLLSSPASADQVIPDDLIVQSSLCVGFDCVNGEAFNFATIRLKENNTRIDFQDTSAGTFPTRDWRIEANSNANGGPSYLALKDMGNAATGSEGGTAILTATAAAPANSLFISSAGRVGFRTATPVLDLHINTSNTPGIRLEQNSSGGFTAQTWDIAGNEANFFIRDVTGGSLLPLRIRPGAPTSSLDIAASGNVGVGTAAPDRKLTVNGGGDAVAGVFRGTAAGGTYLDIDANTADGDAGLRFLNEAGSEWFVGFDDGDGDKLKIGRGSLISTATPALTIQGDDNVGIGTTAPSAQLHTTGTVRFAGLPSCANGIITDASGNLACSASSRLLKNVGGVLEPERALANVMALRPHYGAYKDSPDVPEHWLLAEDVAAVDPALAGFKDGEPYTVKTYGVVADLVAVIQLQQRRIEALEQASSQR